MSKLFQLSATQRRLSTRALHQEIPKTFASFALQAKVWSLTSFLSLMNCNSLLCRSRSAVIAIALSSIIAATDGCERMVTPRNTQIVKDADAKATEGDYLRAISLYESALDDSPRCADIHYKLALLYDDKMNDPLNALHHYKRYLTLNPTGPRAIEVKNFMKRDEVTLATTLSGDAIVTRQEAARLKNENLKLRKELEDRALKLKAASDNAGRHGSVASNTDKKAGNRSYDVEAGDTRYCIA